MNSLFSDKNLTSSCGRPKCFRQGRLMLTAKLICFVMIGLAGLTHNTTAQESPVFIGSSLPVADSIGTLAINNDPQYDDTFQWESSDSILGEIATESVTATRWTYLPGSPARLVFIGNGNGATFYGNVLFEPYNRAVVDVVKDSKRVRYLLKVAELNLEVQYVPDEIEEGSPGDPFTGGLIFINNDRDDPENEIQYPDYGSNTADFNDLADASEDDDLIYVKVNVHGIPGVTVQIQVQVVQGEDKIQLWETVNGVTPSSLVEYTGDPKTVTVSDESDELLLIMEGKNASDLLNDVRLVATFNIGENSDTISQDIVTMTVNDIRNVNRQGEEVGEYTTPIPSEVLEPFSHEPGKPGGPGGFGGPPEDSGMTFLMDPYRIVDFVHTVNPDGPDTVTLTLVSNVAEDWTRDYELVEKDPNRYGNDEDFLALEILEEDPTDVMTIEKKVIEIASTEFGIIREMELFETEAASDTFRSRSLELVVTMDALPDPSIIDTLDATVTSSLLPGEEHNEELTETGPDTYEFQSEDGTLKIVFIRFGDDEEWRGDYDVDYFTAKVTSDLLDIDEEPVDAIETAESSLEFRTDVLHNTNGGEVSTGAYIAIGQKIVWFSEVEKAKTPPGTKRIRASLWYKPQGGSFKVLGGSNGIAGLWDSDFQFNLQTKRLVYPLLILEAKDNNRDAIFKDNIVKCYLKPGDELWVNLEPAKKGWGCIKRTVVKVDVEVHANDTDTHKIGSVLGANGKDHFVCVKGTGDIILDATLNPNTTDAADVITWEADGATITSPAVGTDKTTAKLSSTAAKKIPVRIKVGSCMCWEGYVWVVSVPVTTAPIAININVDQTRTSISGGYNFEHTIQPASIIPSTNSDDVPDLKGANNAASPPPNVPAGDTSVYQKGVNLSGGVNAKWDGARRARQNVINPSNIPFATNGNHDPKYYTTYNNFPSDALVGNDDANTVGEDNNPYTAPDKGKLTGSDNPTTSPLHSEGSVNDTFEIHFHAKEFSRLQLKDTWYRASDDTPWKIHWKFKKVDEAVDNTDHNGDGDKVDKVWIDDGTFIDTNNTGF